MNEKESINRIIEIVKRYNNKIYCYGAGFYGRITRAFLDEEGVDIKGFIVSDTSVNPKSVLRVPVISFDEYMKRRTDDDLVLLTVNEDYARSIIQILTRNGIADYVCVHEENIIQILKECKFSKDYTYGEQVTVFVYHWVGCFS